MKAVLVCIYTAVLSIFFSSIVHAQPKAAGDEISKVVKNVYANLRAGKSAKVFQFVDMDIVSRNLLGEYYYQQATDAQRKEFTSLFQSLYTKIAMSQASEKFKNVSTVRYGQPEIKGNEAWVLTTLVFDRQVKKEEFKLQYSLIKTKQGWRVIDAAMMGSSVIQNIRNDHINPALQNGSLLALLTAMRERNAE